MFVNRLEIETAKLWPNDGQIAGLPQNPRFIKDEKFAKLKQSIEDDPEFLELREIVVIEHAGEYVIIGGNMRYRACVDLGIKKVPCKVIPSDTPVEKLKAFVMKDNISYGLTDWDLITNEWNEEELEYWGMDLPIFDEPVEEDDEPMSSKKAAVKFTIELSDASRQAIIRTELEDIMMRYPEAMLK